MGLKNSKVNNNKTLKKNLEKLNNCTLNLININIKNYYSLFLQLIQDYFNEKNLFLISNNKSVLLKIKINKSNKFILLDKVYIIKSKFKETNNVFELRKQEVFEINFFTMIEKYLIYDLKKNKNINVDTLMKNLKIIHTIGKNQIFESFDFILLFSKNFKIIIISQGNGIDNRKVSSYFSIKILNYLLMNNLNDIDKVINKLQNNFLANYNKELIDLKENGINFLISFIKENNIIIYNLGDFEITRITKDFNNKNVDNYINSVKDGFKKDFIYSNGMEIRKVYDNSDRIFVKGRNFPGILSINQLGFFDLNLKIKTKIFKLEKTDPNNIFIFFNDSITKFNIINHVDKFSETKDLKFKDFLLNKIKNNFLENQEIYKEYIFIIFRLD